MLETLSLSKIRLYLNNPRLSKSENEQEALYKIVEDQQKKLVLLAKDIVEHGLSELDVIAVFPDTESGYYRVAEGNRRVSALRLLQNPYLIKDRYPIIAQEIAEVNGRESVDFEHINVSLFSSEDDPELIHFLELRHLGEQGGIGTVRWDAKQKGRFDYRVYGKENLIIFLDDLANKKILTPEQINGVTKTNWERILRPIGLNFLQLSKENGTYKINPGHEAEFTKKIRLVADALYEKTVAIVYGRDEIKGFFSEMEKIYKGEGDREGDSDFDPDNYLPERSTGPALSNSNCFTHNSKDNGHPLADAATLSRRMPRDPFKNCPSIIPGSIRIQSRNHRITLIIQELKELEVEKYPNACGCLLRALIELCAKEYIEHNHIRSGDATEIEFSEAIFIAKDDMVQKGLITVEYGRIIKRETEKGGVRQLFNGYMHNTDSYPSTVIIKEIFHTYNKFLQQCLL